ncbi:MAG: M60 family metallopeptidase [Bacteroidaceae bacterium]|nr:M60 family metallopeptidase [Bacteroidaceae bacterium]
MRLKSLFLTLLVMLSGVAMAQVESGKVYRIVSSKYNTVITASPITSKLTCVSKGSEADYQQMWEFTLDANTGKYYIQNVFSRRYIQNESGTNVNFKTGNSMVGFTIRENAVSAGHYNIDASNRAGGWGLHCAQNADVVPWSDGTAKEGISGTEWTFEEVSIDQLTKDQAYAEYQVYNSVLENKASIIEKVSAMFSDKAGTQLKSEYASMSDAEIIAALEGVPADLQQAVLKVKNNSWATEGRANLSEKNFRIYDYKPYSNPEQWKDILYHRPFNRINNPTGICSTSDKGFVYVFVDEIPAGTTMYLAEMNGTSYFGTDTELVEGLNIVPSSCKDGVLYIRYNCDTHTGFDVATKSGPKKLSDYPAVKVHIEGGYVNGFWSKERGHNNEDWVYMRDNMFKNPMAVQAVGDHSMLDFRTYEFLKECPDNIVGVMQLWDFWNERQRWYMNLDDYYDYFNNKQLAMSDDGGFMDAGNYRTHYNNNTLSTIVNYNLLVADGGSTWGPLHEIGHTNQYAIEIVGTSEVSNNALANFTLFDIGTHTSRGNNLENQILDFENNVPYVLREEGKYGKKLFSMTRMYFQLFLYFHAAGKNPEFYPTLFEELRADKLVGWVTSSQRGSNHPSGECDGDADHPMDANGFVLGSMDATNDQLKFVEKCCSIAQMDLTEFFEAWGFFIPMKNGYVGDYGHHHVYLLQDSIDAVKARIKKANYPKKGGHLMFLEDRIRPSKKMASAINSNTNGYRADYSWEVPVGSSTGLYGQWEDYVDESVKAQGYYYAISDGKVTIVKDTNASGALGFKLYDKESGKLLTFTNKESMKIPVLYMNNDLVVCAAQADGNDYVVPHASQGPESMQRGALEKSLATARKYKVRKATSGTEIGYFHPNELEYLENLYNEANAAFNNNDTSKHSYAEWSIMLDNECKRLVSTDGTRVLFEEGMEANIYSASSQYTLTNTYMGLVASGSTNDAKAESRWSIEYAGETGVYYLKCADGNYVKDFAYNSIVYADVKGTASAARFSITYTENGNLLLTRVGDGDAVGLGATNDDVKVNDAWHKKVMGVLSSETAAEWFAYVYKNNSAAFYKQELENAMTEANIIVAEILDIANINTMNIFKSNVVVLDRNLETYVVDLYNHYKTVSADIENAAKHKAYLTTFRELLKRIEGTYIVTAPLATEGQTIAWYRLMDNNSGEYLSVDTSKEDRLTLADEYSLSDTELWAFAPTGRQNEFKVYNCALNGYISNKDGKSANYLYITENIKPLTAVYDANKKAVAFTDGEKYLRKQSSNVNLGTMSNALYWSLELVSIEEDKELADIITIIESVLEEGDSNADCYDLSGRKVENPGKGIYIQNGKKVILK